MTAEQKQAYLRRIDAVNDQGVYKPDWQSLAAYPVPQWYKEAKFGIFIHWGIYSVPAYFSEWYCRLMYYKGNPVHWYHLRKYGKNFNYRDFIPMFKAEKFSAEEWVKLVKSSGAKFVMPVGEHHDGFKMYDSDLSEWNSVNMGPKRDVLGELKKACDENGLIFSTSSHRAEHYWFLNGGKTVGYPNETQNDAYRSFYGPCQNVHKANNLCALLKQEHGIEPEAWWLEDWLVSSCDLIDRYQPASLFFDWWVSYKAFRPYMKKFLAYYYNRSLEWGKEVCVYYKSDAVMYNCAIFDRERGQLAGISPYIWQGETSTAYNAWSYCTTNHFKKPEVIACNFLDVISKNGCFVLNLGPKADGTFCKQEQDIISELGNWTKTNGEAIWGTEPYKVFGEGKKQKGASFTEHFHYTAKDFRFTYKTGVVYAFSLKPYGKSRFCIKTLADTMDTFHCVIKNIRVLAGNKISQYKQTKRGLEIQLAEKAAQKMPLCFKIEVE